MNMTNANPFLQWWAAGYKDLVPVVPPNARANPNSHVSKSLGKSPGVLYPNGLWGGIKGWEKLVATETHLAEWGRMGASVGLRTGLAFLLDLDIYDKETADHIEREAIRMLGPAPVRVGQAPKRALLYRGDGLVERFRLRFRGKNGEVNLIEITAQTVVQGIHAKTGKPYAWTNLKPFDQLTIVTPDAVSAFISAMKTSLPGVAVEGSGSGRVPDQQSLAGKVEVVAEAITRLPNTKDMRWDYMIKVGYAVKAALPDHEDLAFDLWKEWCYKWEDTAEEDGAEEMRWSSLKGPYRIGATWLCQEADKYAPKPDGKNLEADLWFEEMPDVSASADDDSPFAQVELNASKDKPNRFRLLSFDEAADGAISDTANPLIKGLLDQGAMSVLYGDSNVGKTFVAMDMGYHIATGAAYAGLRTEHMFVIYVAMEGGRGAKRRLAALREKFKPGAEPLFRLLPSAVDLRRPEVDLNDFIAALKTVDTGTHKIGLIVVDTLARAMAGGDENSSVDMGAIVKNVGTIQAAVDAHVMVVHHTGKDKAKGARGHTSLRAATDTELEVGEGIVSVTKQRDLDKSWSSAFSLEVRTLGLDRDGDPVTSCTVKLDVVSAARKREATEGELAVLDAIETISDTADKPEKGARTKDLEAWCKDNLSGMTRDTLNQHLRGLRSKSLISQKTRGFWLSERKSDCEDLLSDCEESVFS